MDASPAVSWACPHESRLLTLSVPQESQVCVMTITALQVPCFLVWLLFNDIKDVWALVKEEVARSIHRSHVHGLSFSAATTMTPFVRFPLNNTEFTPCLANMRMRPASEELLSLGRGCRISRGGGLKYTCNILHNNSNKLKLKLIWKVCLLMTHIT